MQSHARLGRAALASRRARTPRAQPLRLPDTSTHSVLTFPRSHPLTTGASSRCGVYIPAPTIRQCRAADNSLTSPAPTLPPPRTAAGTVPWDPTHRARDRLVHGGCGMPVRARDVTGERAWTYTFRGSGRGRPASSEGLGDLDLDLPALYSRLAGPTRVRLDKTRPAWVTDLSSVTQAISSHFRIWIDT